MGLSSKKLCKKHLDGTSLDRHLPLYDERDFTDLPVISNRPFRAVFKQHQKLSSPYNASSLSFFIGCAVDLACPQVGINVVEVLNHLGYRVNFPESQVCCGAPSKYMGDLKTARKMARENIQVFEKSGDEPIIVVCPTCASALLYDYEALFTREPEWVFRAKKIAKRVIEFTQFLSLLPENKKSLILDSDAGGESVNTGNKFTKVTYHDSCRLKGVLGIAKQPRELLKYTPGISFIEMQNPDCCCGYGGSCAVRFPELSGPVVEKKLTAVEQTNAEILTVACPGCLMQLNRELSTRGSEIKVRHVAELIASSIK